MTYSKQTIPPYPEVDEPSIELDIIADVDSIGGYEWDCFIVLRDPQTRHLYVVEDGGCSCNGPYDDIRTLNDLDGPFTMHEVASRAQAWEVSEGWAAERRAGLGARVVEALLAMERAS